MDLSKFPCSRLIISSGNVIEGEAEDPIECLKIVATSLKEHYKAFRDPEFSKSKTGIENMIRSYENDIQELLSTIDLNRLSRNQREKVKEILSLLLDSAPPSFLKKLNKYLSQENNQTTKT